MRSVPTIKPGYLCDSAFNRRCSAFVDVPAKSSKGAEAIARPAAKALGLFATIKSGAEAPSSRGQFRILNPKLYQSVSKLSPDDCFPGGAGGIASLQEM
jgi:hypothetical protein